MPIKKIKEVNKILTIPGWYPSERSPNNGDFVKNQIALLRKEGMDIDVVYADISVWNWKNVLQPSNPIGSAYETLSSYWSIPRNRRIGMKYWRRRYETEIQAYIQREGRPRLIHAHTFLGGWASLRISKALDIPLVLTAHYTGFLTGMISDIHDEIAKETFESCNKVYAVSEALASSLTKRYNIDCQVFPNFIDIELFRIKERTERGPNIRIIAVGDLIERKQIGTLLKAVKGIGSVEVIVAGDGPLRSSLIKLAKELDVKAQFIGHQPQAQLSEWYSQCDFLVHPSKTETFGLVVIEAMACGLPVITCNNGGSKNIINPKNGIYVEDSTHTQLKMAIVEMINNLEAYSSELIRKTVVDRYAPEVLAKRLSKEYTYVISQ